jgi:general secretion pathway protein K
MRLGQRVLQSNRGIALLMVLWILTILMVIVLSFAFMARTEVYSTVSFRDGLQKKFLAEAAIERGIMELFYRGSFRNQATVVEGSESIRADGRLYKGEIEADYYTYTVTDESGKININTLTDTNGIILNNLLVNLGVSGDDANTIVDSILDWRDTDELHRLHGAESDYYLSLPIPYKAKNANFDTIEELLLVKGMTAEILFGHDNHPGLISFLTTLSRGSTINVNAASREVLAALPNMTSNMAERLVELRESVDIKGPQDITAIIGDAYRAVSPLIGFTDSNTFTIEGTGFKAGEKRGFAVKATLTIEGGNKYRYLYYKSPAGVAE